MITSIFKSNNNFPDSKDFAINQFKADQLAINTLAPLYKQYTKAQEDLAAAQERKYVHINLNAEFLCNDGFTPEYKNERQNRKNVLYATPVFSGLSMATGIYIIFGINIVLSVIFGVLLAYAAFFYALYDKVLESKDGMKWTFILFLAMDAVLLIIGLFIGISNEVPSIYLFIHSILCVFALLLNFSMIRHAENYNQDKVKADKKGQLQSLKDVEKKVSEEGTRIHVEINRYMKEFGESAVRLRAGFVAHNYNPSTVRMTIDTRMMINQIFGYDLFPVIDEIVGPDYVWERRAITKWNEDTSSLYPKLLSEFGQFSASATFTALPVSRQNGNEITASNQFLAESNDNTTETNTPNSTATTYNASVFQSPESENEL